MKVSAMSTTQQWIDLRDKTSGAKLRTGKSRPDSPNCLFISGLSRNNPKWNAAINELGFTPSPNGTFLMKLARPGDRIILKDFQKVWPDAVLTQMPLEEIDVFYKKSVGQRSAEERDMSNELQNAKRIGRNLDGDEVYENGVGRFIYRPGKGSVPETSSLKPAMFLHAPDAAALDECASGFVKAMLMNDVLRSDDLSRFTRAVFDIAENKPIEASQTEAVHEVIDAAITRVLVQEFDTANDAYGESVRLYENKPQYTGRLRGAAALPIPLAVISQRLLGDTTGQTIVIPNAFDGALFSFLPKGTRIRAFRGGRDLSVRAEGLKRAGLEWNAHFQAARETNSDGMIFNADPILENGERSDYKDAMLAIRSMAPDGRAVFILAGDDPQHPGVINEKSRKFFDSLYTRYSVEDVFEVSKELTKGVGSQATLRVISIRNRAPNADEAGMFPLAPEVFPVCHSWDQAKARVDESLAREAIREAESEGIDINRVAEDNLLQRPYLAFSRVGEAVTMVPKELQQPLQAFMSDLEALNGPVDEYVEKELGFAGDQSLSTRFSPEQVDALGMMISRMKKGRGHILGDETGIGKGRTLAGLTTWALKQGHPVVFITDRANLFSDLARDLRDIGEWGRVRPFVMNADGQIVDTMGSAGVLAESVKSSEMRRIIASNASFTEAGGNVIFTTYSQISGEDSDKALWLKNQLKDALLIVDEAHVAAGSDSNISTQIAEMTSLAWNVQYSSATWAKSAANLHIFARAFPESVNVATLAKTMKRGGEAFSEIFSSMLAREGALMRREHDLSKLEFSVEVDTVNTDRNNAIADRVAEIMSSLAYTAGSLKRIVTRMSDVNIAALREARDVRSNAEAAKIFKSRFGTGSMLYQVNRRINAALNVENAVRIALEGINEGSKPVIVFEDTGESFIKQALESQAITQPDGSRTLPTLLRPPTIRDLLRRILETLQTVKVEEVDIEDLPGLAEQNAEEEEEFLPEDTLVDTVPGVAAATVQTVADTQALPGGEGGVEAAPVVQEAGIVVEQVLTAIERAHAENVPLTPIKVRKKYKLVPFWQIESLSESDRKTFDDGVAEITQLIDSLPEIPLNAPDEIKRRLTDVLTGSGDRIRVGELSGRSFYLEALNDGSGLSRIIPRPKSKSHVTSTVRAFNGGPRELVAGEDRGQQLDCLLINRSAATGISLHASPRFFDRRRRMLIELQIPENPTDRLQLYGRVNRYDQESFPRIIVASTGIYGEVRQIMVQNKKLSEMSANVRSSRDSHALIKDVPDLLNPLGREVCRHFLEDNPEILSRLDMDQADLDPASQKDLSTMLTSRIPLLRIEEQKQVYEQLYSMFDDAIIQAEMSGFNPLKPNEMDVRAKVGKPKLLFGFDHKGLGSAFDGPVFAQRLDWKEDVRPMAIEAIIEVVKVNRAKLIASGRAKEGPVSEGGTVTVDMTDLAKRAAKQLEGRARLAVAGTQFKNSDEAMRDSKPNPIKRGMARSKWIEKNLEKLTPGRIISMPRGEAIGEYFLRRNAVILDIVPPADRRESQLAQWRVLTISPGESRPVSTTLNALIGNLVFETPITSTGPRGQREQADATQNPTQVPGAGEVYSKLDIGSDIVALHEASEENRKTMKNSWIYNDFSLRYVGLRERKALVLTGNMYLAAEWAAQTKAGTGVIFTDERGLRQRGIILKDNFKPEWLKYLPSRLWMPGMIERFVEKIAMGEVPCDGGRHVMYTTFDGAWKATESSQSATTKDQLLIIPGQGVMMHIGKESRRRINGMLRQAQKQIKMDLFPGVKVRPQDDPGHVVIKETAKNAQRLARRGEDAVGQASRKESDFLIMQAETPEKLKRAFQMLMKGPGLEIFVPPAIHGAVREINALAHSCMEDYYIERLREDAQDDPVRLAQLEKILTDRSSSEEIAQDIDRELSSIRAFSGSLDDSEQVEIDFETGKPIKNNQVVSRETVSA